MTSGITLVEILQCRYADRGTDVDGNALAYYCSNLRMAH